MRNLYLVSLLALTACHQDEPAPTPKPASSVLITTTIESELASDLHAQKLVQTPAEWLPFASEGGPPRPVQTVADAKQRLQSDPALDEMRKALTAAGYSPEEQAGLLARVSAYNSNTPADPSWVRMQGMRAEMKATAGKLDQAIDQAARESGTTLDRQKLYQGIYGDTARYATEVK